MIVDKLILGNVYLWVDPDGQSRPAKFEGGCLLRESTLGYRFKVRGYRISEIRLSEQEVNESIFRTPITPL